MAFPTRQALRSVLPDIEELTEEDLGLLFMKIDANGSGDIDWDEFTGFLLQAREKVSSFRVPPAVAAGRVANYFEICSRENARKTGGGGRGISCGSHLVSIDIS